MMDHVSMWSHNGISIGGSKEKVVAESLIRKAMEKMESLDLKKEKETFVESRREMAKDEASTSEGMVYLKADEVVKPFL